MPLPLAGLGGLLGGAGKAAVSGGVRAAATGGGRAILGGAFGAAKDSIIDSIKNRKSQDVQSETPFSGNVAEGIATAVKGSGGGGGALVTTGGGGGGSSSSAIVKSGGKDILSKFDVLISAFRRLIEIEKENKKRLEQQILDFARGSEKQSRSAEEAGQEKSKAKSDKNPIVEGGKKAFKGIFGFIGDLVNAFITYKILDWISKPENTKAIKNTVQFFMNVGKLLGFIGKFVIGPVFNVLKELITGQFKVFGEVIEAITNIFSLKWLTNPLEFLKDLLDIPKAIVDMSFNVIKSVIDFLTFGLVKMATDTISNGIKGFFGVKEETTTEEVSGQKSASEEVSGQKSASEPTQAKQPENPLQKTGNLIKGVAGGIGGVFKGLFGGGGSSDETPQLREGGVVSNNGVKVEPLDGLSKISGVGSYIGKTIKMFMDLLTMPFKLVGAAMIALIMNTVGKIPGVGPFIKPILQNIISKFGLPSSLASMVMGKSPEKMKEKKKKKKEPDKKPNTKPSASPAPTDPNAAADTNTPSGGGVSGAPTSTASETLNQAGGLREDGSLQGVKGSEKIIGNTRGGGTLKEYSPGAGLQPVDGSDRKLWYNNAGDVFRWTKPGDPLTDITSASDNMMLDPKTLGGELVRDLKNGSVKVIKGMFGGDQTPIGYYNYRMKSVLKERGNPGQGRSNTGKTSDKWEKPQEGLYGPSITTPEQKARGGWISGPQSGYPVSLDGGRSTSFIGHGTEWVGFKKASGGTVSSAFVVPFDTPATRSNGGLVGRRMGEAKSGGYALPFSSGGVVKTDGIWDTGPGYTVKGHSDQQGRPIVFSQPAAQAFAQMITASGGKVRGSDVASSKRSPEKNSAVGGASGSKHMTGIAMDIHGQSNSWIRQNGSKYGWVPNDYPGSHGGHFEFKGAGLTPSGTSSTQQQKEDGTQPDAPTDPNKPAENPGFMGSGATTEQLMYLMQNLGMSKSGAALTDVQSQNIVSQSFAGAGKPGGIKVIASENKDISSAMETIQTASLGNTLPKDGKWSRYAFNL